jgi:putative nucleotidyltransferase with HDIG domain
MRYRLWQFWQGIHTRPLTTAAWAEVTAVLNPAELALFSQFSANDRWHSVRVLRLVRAAGGDEPALYKAALLHDIGKTRVPLTIIDRIVVVLGSRLWPKQTIVWGNGEAQGWRRPFVVKAQHPAWGAEMAAAAGSDLLTITLIQRHQDALNEEVEEPKLYEQLRVLQWADDQS